MSLSRKRSRQRTTAVGVVFGLVLIFVFLVGLIKPDLGSRTSSSSSVSVTDTPSVTEVVVPTPDPNPQLEGELPYIHSSGYFQTFRPAGSDWVIDEGESVNASTSAKVVIQSPQRLVVIHNYIQPGVEYESLDALSTGYLTPEHFAGAWANYESWTETGRTVSGESVIVNFDLLSQNVRYLSRSIYRLEGNWLYVIRLVVPANNPSLLDLLQQLVVPSFVSYSDLLALPQSWPAYSDQQLGFIFKHAPDWKLVAGSPGHAVTFSLAISGEKNTVRLWTVPVQPLQSAEEAEAWVQQNDPGVTLVGSNTITHATGQGYQVGYTYLDEQGDAHSGLDVLLNDAAGTLFIASLRINPPDLNLAQAPTLQSPYSEALQGVVGGFMVLPEGARQPATSTP